MMHRQPQAPEREAEIISGLVPGSKKINTINLPHILKQRLELHDISRFKSIVYRGKHLED